MSRKIKQEAARPSKEKYKNLIDSLQQELAVSRKLGDRQRESEALGDTGTVYLELGEPGRAIEFFEQQLKIVRQGGDRQSEDVALGNIGIAHAKLGEPRRAIELFEQALTIEREISNQRGEAYSLWNISLALHDLSDYAEAIPYAEAALKIFKLIKDPNTPMVQKLLAQWRKKAVKEIGKKKIGITEALHLNNLLHQGTISVKQGEHKQAIDHFKQALTFSRKIGYRQGEADALFYTSIALIELGNRAQAVIHADAALKIYKQIESPNADKVRDLLAQWREETDKKWWQFWK